MKKMIERMAEMLYDGCERIEEISAAIFTVCFALVGLAALAGALFAGAWWHLGTAAACALMVLAWRKD